MMALRRSAVLGRAALSICLALFFSTASAEAIFDLDQLKQRGLGAGIAEYFKRESRFLPGDQDIDVIINGIRLGKRSALFGPSGDLCLTKAFTQSVSLVDIDPELLAVDPDRKCPDYRVMTPRTIIMMKPGVSLVDITVPSEYVLQSSSSGNFESGGIGAMLNYRANATQSQYSGSGGYSSKYLDLQAGLNIEDWMVRSKQSLSIDNGRERWNWSGAYVAKSFASQGKQLQFGRLSTQDPIFGGVPINGLQWIPERAARRDIVFPVNGMANTRSTVEIRQNGILLLKTIVPPGPFALSDYPLRNTASDLQVTVTGDSGVSHSFSVPAALLMQARRENGIEGLHLSIGKIWNASASASGSSPLVATASNGWNYKLASGASGAMVSPGYLSLGSQVSVPLGEPQRHSIFFRATSTHDLSNRAHGLTSGGGINSQITDRFSAAASVNVRTGQVRSAQQAATRDTSTLQTLSGTTTQIGLSASWNTTWFGGISGSVSQERSPLGDIGQVLTVGWSGHWRRMNMSLGLSQSNFRSATGSSAASNGNTYFFASLNVPLGSFASTSSNVRYQGGDGQATASFTSSLFNVASISGSTERSFGKNDRSSSSASVSTTPRYTSMTAGMSRSGSGGSVYGSASGSIIATKSGVAFSPTNAQDSFGIAKTGEVMGVQINSPGGTVWSGPGGLAAIPSYIPYHESRIEVATKSVGLDVDIDHGLWGVKAARGAVIDLDMGVKKLRRVVFIITRPDGSLLPTGSLITNGDGEMIATSLARGKLLISNLKDDTTYFADDANNNRCRIEQLVFLGKKEGQLFDSGTAVCVPLDDAPVQEATDKPRDAGEDLI